MLTPGVAGAAASCLRGHLETSVRLRPALGTPLSPPGGLQSFPVCSCYSGDPRTGCAGDQPRPSSLPALLFP